MFVLFKIGKPTTTAIQWIKQLLVSSVLRKRVRFDRAAEFLAACASGDTEEAQLMLMEAKENKRRNGEDVGEIINCSNADGITALHQV